MPVLCHRACRKQQKKANDKFTGVRAAFYPNGGTYKGYWLRSQQHQYGQKETVQNLCYDGLQRYGKRHGCGTMRRRLVDGTSQRIYIGQYRNDKKWGEGKQHYPDGSYYGWWLNNRRHGLGIRWYDDGAVYLGEWRVDVFHGSGVLFYANGNRYEGNFARGFKNGEGTFYHMHTGQIQKGVWENDNCISSIVIDGFRQKTDQTSKYPIPKCELDEPDELIRKLFQTHIYNAFKPWKSFNELSCLCFVKKTRIYAKFESKAVSDSKMNFVEEFPYSCAKQKFTTLREL